MLHHVNWVYISSVIRVCGVVLRGGSSLWGFGGECEVVFGASTCCCKLD